MTASILTKRYSNTDREDWNDFVARAKNSTFLFNREYVEYHSDRFTDHSLLIYLNNKLSALLIANQAGNRIESHGGLTYGGLILEPAVKLEQVLQFFYHIVKHYHSEGIETIVYKCLPSYYFTCPSNEDLYALFLLKAGLIRRETSMVVDQIEASPVKTKNQASFKIVSAKDPQKLWNEVIIPTLSERYDTEPVHSISDMKLLMERFPNNIHLYEVYDTELIAGAIVYSTSTVAHFQYIFVNEAGRKARASNALVNYLVKDVYKEKRFISFGTSNTNNGRGLNRGLITWKESFGARTFIHDFYEIETVNHNLLAEYE